MTKRIFAHRGLSRLAPENTLAAFRALKPHRVPWLETDLDLTADGDIIILHDADLDRTTDHTGSVHELTHTELANVDAGSWFGDAFIGEPLPTLDQVMAIVNEDQLNVNFELKAHLADDPVRRDQLIDQFSDALGHLNPKSDILVSSFSPEMLQRFSAVQPDVKTAALFKKEQLDLDWISIAKAAGASAVHPEVVGLTKERVQAMKTAGLDVNVWTVNSLSQANQLFNWGVDGVFTDIAQDFPSRYLN